MNGWIKVDRSVLEWEWYTDLNTFKLWMHINLICNIVPQKRMLGYTLEPGQVITTLPKLAAETGLTLQEVRTALKHLESSGDITQMVTNKFRLITLENWAFSQGFGQSTNSQLTDQQQSTNSPLTGVKKEDKNKEQLNLIHLPTRACARACNDQVDEFFSNFDREAYEADCFQRYGERR